MDIIDKNFNINTRTGTVDLIEQYKVNFSNIEIKIQQIGN